MRFTWAQISARRLARNHLSRPATDPAHVAASVLGVHAQVMSAAELSIGVRTSKINREDVRHQLWTTKSLVKTRGPRGTVHLLAAADLPMWIGALAALPHPGSRVDLSAAQTDEIVAAIADAVAGADLTVDELTDAIVARVGAWAGERTMDAFQDKWPRWRQIEDVAANRGAMCFGPVRERRVTYTRLPSFAPMPADEALPELVRRFLYAYGPATPAQFARWLGSPPAWTAKLFERDDLERVDFDGAAAYVNRGDTEAGGRATGVRLLPYFDAYGIACSPRERLFPGPAADRALNRGQAGNIPILLVNGVVGGVWHQKSSGRKMAFTVEPLSELTGRQKRALDDEVDRIGAFSQATPSLTIGPVTAGPHA
jgi:hypothetical protein